MNFVIDISDCSVRMATSDLDRHRGILTQSLPSFVGLGTYAEPNYSGQILAKKADRVNNLKTSFLQGKGIMRLGEIVQIVDGNSDPAFAIDGLGNIVAWNQSACDAFGISSAEAIGNACCDIICGVDDDGTICSRECIVRCSAYRNRLMPSFDLRVHTPTGQMWFGVTSIIISSATAFRPYIIHILRPIDIQKRLEVLLCDFVIRKTNISRSKAVALVSSTRSMARETALTNRETEILRLVAKGRTSISIAEKLQISRTTVDNHLQHILKKLNTHSRLEAVLRAEHAGLL